MERDELRKGYTIYEDKDGNTVQIAEDVIASIAAMSMKDIKGVYAVGSGMKNGIMEKLGWEDLAKGVTVEVLEDGAKYTGKVVAIDAAGNTSLVPISVSFVIGDEEVPPTETVDKSELQAVVDSAELLIKDD